MAKEKNPHRFNPNSNADGLLNASCRAQVEGHLRTTLRIMQLAYGSFTLGFILLLFRPEPGLALMISAVFGMIAYSWIRNRRIRKLGFTRHRPYPAEWSEDFNEAETELFKKFTVTWTVLLTVWTLMKLLPGSG